MEALLAVIGLVIAAVLPVLVDRYWLVVLILMVYVAYQGVAWNIVAGLAGQLSLCNALFVAVGAYTSTLLANNWHITPWLGMFAGAALAAAVAAAVGLLFFRYRVSGMSFALGTFAVSQIALWFLIGTRSLGARDGLQLPVSNDVSQFQFLDPNFYYFAILAMLVVAVVVVWRLRNSKLGYYFLAIRDDQEAAESLGIGLVRTKVIALVVSASFAAIGGTFLAQYLLFTAPELLLKPAALLPPVIVTMFGGIGTNLGPLIGAAMLVPASQWLRSEWGAVVPGLDLILYGVVLMAVITFLPEGIAGSAMTRRANSVARRIRVGPTAAGGTDHEDGRKFIVTGGPPDA